MDDRLVVAIDTSSAVVGLAVGDGQRSLRERRAKGGVEAVLLRWLDECLEELGFEICRCWGCMCHRAGRVHRVAVGLATAGGLAMGWDVPVWTVDALRSVPDNPADHAFSWRWMPARSVSTLPGTTTVYR